ncbi:MAG: hypothetical protein JWQ25_1321, partial [Daejeonella sp.]|nr:hypothetical protein [Daejeonella sp.]
MVNPKIAATTPTTAEVPYWWDTVFIK